MDERVRHAGLLYEQAVFGGDASLLDEADRELDAAEAELALARGRILHTRFLLQRDHDPASATENPAELPFFERAAQRFHRLDDVSGEAEALFWAGCFHQVVRRDNVAAVRLLQRSLELATEAGEKATMAEALRHLGIDAHFTGHPDVARRHLEESTRLRREIGLMPGVAANLVGLAYVARAQGRRADIQPLLDEAAAIADASGAGRIAESVIEAREELAGQDGPPG
ncbi:MAG TPA: tetratricopeptide repeat protein [Streptosporangiaceae bacterium]